MGARLEILELIVMFDKEWVKTILYFIVMLLCVYLLIHYVGQRTVVDGGSMETTLYDGDNLILDKISYRFSDPKRYDIVVFPVEDDFYIKRVIGLPGETVDIIDGKVWIDGEELASDTFGKEPIEYPGLIEMPVTLGEDEYFCMGDNRNNSTDSRDIGPIARDRLEGKIWIRIFPFKKFGAVH